MKIDPQGACHLELQSRRLCSLPEEPKERKENGSHTKNEKQNGYSTPVTTLKSRRQGGQALQTLRERDSQLQFFTRETVNQA
jgi:hypothetical protein